MHATGQTQETRCPHGELKIGNSKWFSAIYDEPPGWPTARSGHLIIQLIIHLVKQIHGCTSGGSVLEIFIFRLHQSTDPFQVIAFFFPNYTTLTLTKVSMTPLSKPPSTVAYITILIKKGNDEVSPQDLNTNRQYIAIVIGTQESHVVAASMKLN
jgi:hypothetical protein